MPGKKTVKWSEGDSVEAWLKVTTILRRKQFNDKGERRKQDKKKPHNMQALLTFSSCCQVGGTGTHLHTENSRCAVQLKKALMVTETCVEYRADAKMYVFCFFLNGGWLFPKFITKPVLRPKVTSPLWARFGFHMRSYWTQIVICYRRYFSHDRK